MAATLAGMPFEPVSVGGARLEVEAIGLGEPVVVIQTALCTDELVPLTNELRRHLPCRTITYHRRGYAGSSPISGFGSTERDAADCQGVLTALGVGAAHVVGVSYSAAVALQLALSAPESVHSLTLVEPPPISGASAVEFRAANARLLQVHERCGPQAALEQFLGMLVGPEWRGRWETALPGSVAQMERDAATFFTADVPTLIEWKFGDRDAERVTAPTLCVGGTDSGPWFVEARQRVVRLLQAEEVVIDGADHSLALNHADQAATAIAGFLRRHSIRTSA